MNINNDVGFKITLDAKHEGGHFLKVKFDWFKAIPPAGEENTKFES